MKSILKATMTALAVAAILPITACGGNEPISAGGTPAPAATATAKANPVKALPDGQADVCSNVDPKTFKLAADLADAYTATEVAAATCEAIRFQYQAGWTNLAVPGDEALKQSNGQAIVEVVRPWLTTRALAKASDRATKAAAGSPEAEGDLFGLTAVNMNNPDWRLRAESVKDSPIVGDRKWSDAIVAIDKTPDAAGRERIDVTIEFTDQMLLTRKSDGLDGTALIVRTVTYAMSQTSLKEHPWLVDAWTVDWEPGKPTLDKASAR